MRKKRVDHYIVDVQDGITTHALMSIGEAEGSSVMRHPESAFTEILFRGMRSFSRSTNEMTGFILVT